jgi:hypothetical protein
MKILGINFGKDNTPVESVQSTPTTNGNYLIDSFKMKYDYSQPLVNERNISNGYVYFGPDNLYPQELNTLYYTSSLHGSILDFKKLLTAGDGYVLNTDKLSGMQLVEAKQMETFFSEDQSIAELLPIMAMDYHIHGMVYFELTWNDDFTKVIRRKRISPEKMRVGARDVNGVVKSYYYCYDWFNRGLYPVKAIPVFDPLNKTDKVQVWRFSINSPGQNVYSLPNYVAAANWIALDGMISNYHKSNIENSVNPSFLMQFYKKPSGPEEKEQIVNSINAAFGGASNTGKVMFTFSDGKDNAPTITPVAVSNIDKQFATTADQIQRNILYAHKMPPLVMGFKTAGSLGSGSELPVSYEIFNKSVIYPAQNDLELIVMKLFRLGGLNVTFKIKTLDLVSTNQ